PPNVGDIDPTFDHASRGLALLNPRIVPGSTSYSNRFTILPNGGSEPGLSIVFESRNGDQAKGQIVIRMQRHQSSFGMETITKSIPILMDLSGPYSTPGAGIETCRAVREDDEYICA